MSDKSEYLIFSFFILLFKKKDGSLHWMSDGVQNSLKKKMHFEK